LTRSIIINSRRTAERDAREFLTCRIPILSLDSRGKIRLRWHEMCIGRIHPRLYVQSVHYSKCICIAYFINVRSTFEACDYNTIIEQDAAGWDDSALPARFFLYMFRCRPKTP
jgi:hypothetical protein